MNKQDIIIKAENLSKIYRLYNRNHYRILDMLGLLGNKPHAYREHKALDGIDLQIKRGEKIAIIGRNGAGKSTLLKLISGVMKPSAGNLTVNGSARALLQIGTGFHKEFSGRENIIAYFAQQGMIGREVDAYMDDIIEFAEIEEYIDQPIKSYSTGMAARLMFATSTAICPELLILDEVLSVGDAYFTQKCIDRVSELSQQQNSTLLLVSHNVYDAAKMSDRMIWMDNGQIVIDSTPEQALKAYEDSVRLQEESRLRKKRTNTLSKAIKNNKRYVCYLVEIQTENNLPAKSILHLRNISLYSGMDKITELPLLQQDHTNNMLTSHLEFENTCWGDISEWQGHPVRNFNNFGSPYHKVAGWFVCEREQCPTVDKLSLHIDYGAETKAKFLVRVYQGNDLLLEEKIITEAKHWHKINKSLQQGTIQQPAHDYHAMVNNTGQFGSGQIILANVKLLDVNSEEQYVIQHGETVHMEMQYKIADEKIAEKPEIVIAIYKNGVQPVCRYICNTIALSYQDNPSGTIRLTIPQIKLSVGSYSLAVFIAKAGYFASGHKGFYSVNPDVYFSHSNVMDFAITGQGPHLDGTIYVEQGDWSLLESCSAQ